MQVNLHSATPALGDVDANVLQVANAVVPGALTVFPELFLTGYAIGDDLQRLAFTDDDPRLEPLREACMKGGHLIVGAPYKARSGVSYNSALCIDDEGGFTWVHKRALPTFTMFQEGLWFGHGPKQEVWQTKLANIGISICYDLYFPEFQKCQVLEGADVLVNISASPSASRRFFEAILPARAIENTVFSLYSNNVGAQDGLVFWGGSRAIGPRGEILGEATPFEEGVITVDLQLENLVAAREFRPTIRDSTVENLELEK